MGSQLQQPSGFDSSHVSHVILGGLYNFIVDNPKSRRKQEFPIPYGENPEPQQAELASFPVSRDLRCVPNALPPHDLTGG